MNFFIVNTNLLNTIINLITLFNECKLTKIVRYVNINFVFCNRQIIYFYKFFF